MNWQKVGRSPRQFVNGLGAANPNADSKTCVPFKSFSANLLPSCLFLEALSTILREVIGFRHKTPQTVTTAKAIAQQTERLPCISLT